MPDTSRLTTSSRLSDAKAQTCILRFQRAHPVDVDSKRSLSSCRSSFSCSRVMRVGDSGVELACAPLRVARRWDGVSMAGRVAALPEGQRSRKDAGLRPKDRDCWGRSAPAGWLSAGSWQACGSGPGAVSLWISVGRCGCGLPRTLLSHRLPGKGSNRSREWEEGPLLRGRR